MDLGIVDALRSPGGQELLARLPHPYDPAATMSLTATLRAQGHSPELVAAALTQSELRTRAERKFGADATRLLFTREGLEQSSRPVVAKLHAERFAEAGVRAVHDLGCGIGGDAIALVRSGIDVDAVDSDPVTASVAAHNLAQVTGQRPGPERSPTLGSARVHRGAAQDPRWRREAQRRLESGSRSNRGVGLWLDPGRRAPGIADSHGRTRRTRSLELMSPPWEIVQRLAQQWPGAGVKLGAGFDPASLPAETEAHWVSHDSETVECLVWWGAMAREPGTRSALVHARARWHRLVASLDVSTAPRVGSEREVGRVLYELDPAVSAAGLRAQVSAELDASLLGSSRYLTSDHLTDTVWARGWDVHEVLPLRTATLRQWARREDVGALTVKRPSRHAPGGDMVPEVDALRRRVAPSGSRPATLLLSDLAPGRAGVALWVSPCPDGGTATR